MRGLRRHPTQSHTQPWFVFVKRGCVLGEGVCVRARVCVRKRGREKESPDPTQTRRGFSRRRFGILVADLRQRMWRLQQLEQSC